MELQWYRQGLGAMGMALRAAPLVPIVFVTIALYVLFLHRKENQKALKSLAVGLTLFVLVGVASLVWAGDEGKRLEERNAQALASDMQVQYGLDVSVSDAANILSGTSTQFSEMAVSDVHDPQGRMYRVFWKVKDDTLTLYQLKDGVYVPFSRTPNGKLQFPEDIPKETLEPDTSANPDVSDGSMDSPPPETLESP